MKNFFYIIPLCLFSIFCTAQPVNNLVGQIEMPAANSASLGQYGDIPVSYNTGVPSTGIPIHTLSEGPLSTSVSLSYHSGGLNVGVPSSWAGLGWALQYGGNISRTVQGLPDEASYGYIDFGDQISVDMNGCIQGPHTALEMAQGQADGEPDIFSFSLGGYNGKFFLQDDGEEVLIPKQDLDIDYELAGATGGLFRLKNFVITTPDGTKYSFGDIGDGNPAIELMKQHSDTHWIANNWYLKRITSPDGKYSINYNYSTEEYKYATRNSSGSGYYGTAGGVHYTITEIKGYRLNTITTSTEKITFVPGANRTDMESRITGSLYPPKQLDKIKIEPINNTAFCKELDLSFGYFVDNLYPTTLAEDKRLKLLSVQEKSCVVGTPITKPAYQFEYYGKSGNLNFLPNKLSTAVDHWGYYNGTHTNPLTGLNMPYTKVEYDNGYGTMLEYTEGSSDRESSEEHMKYGTLKKITYPTGGDTSFEYEANDYWDTEGHLELMPPSMNLSGEQCTWNETLTDQENITFTSTSELNSYRYNWTSHAFSGWEDCCHNNLAILKVFIGSTLVASVTGNAGCSWPPIESTASGYLIDLIPNLQPNVNYTFKMYVYSIGTEFTLQKEEIVGQNTNKKVGGLRIKKITNHDGVSTANNVIRTYEYKDANIPTRSSGKLFNKPQYSYIYTGAIASPCGTVNPNNNPGNYNTHLWIGDGVTPLGSFEGGHISYLNVKENHNGNGYKLFQYFDEVYTPPTTFPIPPAAPRVNMGNIATSATKTNSGADVAY